MAENQTADCKIFCQRKEAFAHFFPHFDPLPVITFETGSGVNSGWTSRKRKNCLGKN